MSTGSFLDGDENFPEVPMNPQPDCKDEECTCDEEELDLSQFLPDLIPGQPFDLGFGPVHQLDERLVHISHLAVMIFCHRKHGETDGVLFSADASVEAAWDIFNRTKKLVDEQDTIDLCDAKKLMAELDAASETDAEDE